MVVGHPAEVGLEAELGLVLTVGGPRGGLGDGGEQAFTDLVEQRKIQVAFGVEVLIDHRLRDAGGLGDIVHRCTVVALAGKDLHSDIKQLLTTGRGGKSDGHSAV